jgi:hypothetical protein
MMKQLVALAHAPDILEVLPIVMFWGVGLIATSFALVWSVAVFTVVRRGPEELTIGFTLGGVFYRRVTSVLLKDLTDMVARERLYGNKGGKMRGCEILFGPEKEKSKLLARLRGFEV